MHGCKGVFPFAGSTVQCNWEVDHRSGGDEYHWGGINKLANLEVMLVRNYDLIIYNPMTGVDTRATS